MRFRPRVLLVALPLLAWSIGAALFLRADGSVSWTLDRTREPPNAEHNLALYQWGPTLRASSYYREVFSHHHPIFLTDARATPHEVEKWTSSARDSAPWIEISWREPRRLERAVIYHAGWREHAMWTVRRYRLRCLTRAGGTDKVVQVANNTQPVATHALGCRGARGLRIDWTPNERGEQVRIYEVEAWGR